MRSRSRRASWEMAGTLPGFDPRMVPEISAGYFWLASRATGLGTAQFKIPEGGGHTSFDLLQATVASQPTQLTENGGVQLRMRKAADSNPSIINTSGAVQAGWTGNTYIAGWFRLPDASGDVTGASNLFLHNPSTVGQRRIVLSTLVNVTDKLNTTSSNDGTTTATNQWASPFTGAWLWLETIITLGTSVEVVSNGTQLSHTATAAPPSPLFDGSCALTIGCRAAAGLANVDTTDWAAVYYGNGIPTLFNRQRLMAHQAPISTGFA